MIEVVLTLPLLLFIFVPFQEFKFIKIKCVWVYGSVIVFVLAMFEGMG